jgi:hypothetical protein
MNANDKNEEKEQEDSAKLIDISLKKQISTPPPGLVFYIFLFK